MALNAASHNASEHIPLLSVLASTNCDPAAEPTGSPSGPPPAVDGSLNSAVQAASKQDPTGQNVAGQDKQGNNIGQTVMGEAGKEKTAKESMLDRDSTT